MNWLELNSESNIKEIIGKSHKSSVMIYEFNPRQMVDVIVRIMLERDWYSKEMEMEFYILNVLERPRLAEIVNSEFNIVNVSPQLLIINGGKCIYSEISGNIKYDKLRKFSNLYSV
jgi:bacillithiol system protein YtxJ